MNPYIPRTPPEACDCYKCDEQQLHYHDDGHITVMNNMEYHTFHEPCGNCGRPKTEYRDLGRKGRYVCWWCRHRADDY